MLLLGLGCKAQVGKDTAADYLERKFSYAKKVSFADKVKKVGIEVFGLSHEQCYGPKEIKETIDPRYGLTPREILQGIGEKLREIYEDIWVDTVFYTTIPELEKEGYNFFIISDVRYPNEADKVREAGGKAVRIDRAAGGTSVGSDHPSETSLDSYENFDFIIENNGSTWDYFDKIDKLVEDLQYGQDREEGRN